MINLNTFLKQSLKAVNFNVEKLKGDVSTRSFYRVTTPSKKYVLMEAPPESLHQFLSIAEYLKSCEVAVPEIYSHNTNGFVLMEDGGDTHLESEAQKNIKKALPYYEEALSQLAIIQTSILNPKTSCPAQEIKFTSKKFQEELKMTEEFCFQKHFKLSYDKEKLHQEFKNLCDTLTKLPYCFTHRDFHSRNILVGNNHHMMIIDFQDARLGPYQYDVTSLLRDSYVLLSCDVQNRLLQHYFTTIKKLDPRFETQGFLEHYNETTLQRSLKAAGTFTKVYHTTGEDFYLQYIKTTMFHVYEALKDLKIRYPILFKLIRDLKL